MGNYASPFCAVYLDTARVRRYFERRNLDNAPRAIVFENAQCVVDVRHRPSCVMMTQETTDPFWFTQQSNHHVDYVAGHFEKHTPAVRPQLIDEPVVFSEIF